MGNNERIETPPAQPPEEQKSLGLSKTGTAPAQQISYDEKITQAIEKSVEEKVEKRVKETEIRYTEVLGVFVALFTFISINIQIFSRITSLNNALIFVFLMFICLAGFVFLLHAIISKQRALQVIVGLILLIVAIFIFNLLSSYHSYPLSIEESNELVRINQKISELDTKVEVLLRKGN